MDFTYKKGMGIGGWLTNYKRFNVIPKEKRFDISANKAIRIIRNLESKIF
jgi:hypothetical protein